MKKLLLAMMFVASAAQAENADLNKIENYLNNINTLEASFVQMSSNGGSAEGKIYIEKPSKIRMEYTAPDPLLIVGNGDYIIYNDKELDQITNIDYKDIPATMILSNKIKFDGKNLKVADFYKDSGDEADVAVEDLLRVVVLRLDDLVAEAEGLRGVREFRPLPFSFQNIPVNVSSSNYLFLFFVF